LLHTLTTNNNIIVSNVIFTCYFDCDKLKCMCENLGAELSSGVDGKQLAYARIFQIAKCYQY